VGGGDRKQYRMEFQGLSRNDGEFEDIEKEQQGTRRNPYWPLNGPLFFLHSEKFLRFASHASREWESASVQIFAARMAADC
jgi:hypothetical protein